MSDLNPGTELLASFTINSNNVPEGDVTDPETQTTDEAMETTHMQRVDAPQPKSSPAPAPDKPVPSHGKWKRLYYYFYGIICENMQE